MMHPPPPNSMLDVSYNGIRAIENLSTLTELTKIFLANNKIKEIRNLDALVKLTMLELGANRIRVRSGKERGR